MDGGRMAANSDNPLNIRFRGGRPLEEWSLDIYSAELDGQEFFFDAYANKEQHKAHGFYDLDVWPIGKRGVLDARRIQFSESQMQRIKDAIIAYFRTHGRFGVEAPPRNVIFRQK
jgi:hypothetical protein